jgi:putative membrane protein (TIGR04086 family)
MKNIRWGWILLGAFLAEVAIFLIVIPLSLVAGEESLAYGAPVASFVAAFVFGLWIARKAPPRGVLHGILVGVVAMLITLAMTFDLSIPYIVAHLLKVLGGAAGGLVASKRSTSHAAPEARPV